MICHTRTYYDEDDPFVWYKNIYTERTEMKNTSNEFLDENITRPISHRTRSPHDSSNGK